MASIGWKLEVGARPYRVIAEERLDRKGAVYLRWWADGRWVRSATGLSVRRNPKGGVIKAFKVEIERLAKERRDALMNGGQEEPAQVNAPLTILDACDLVFDAAKGLYPIMTAHAKEVKRELKRAAAILGPTKTWDSIVRMHLEELYRARIAVLQAKRRRGYRGAEITVSRVLTVAGWLRENQLIQPKACVAPEHWPAKFAAALEQSANVAARPEQPRHSVEELRRLLAVAGGVDPRLALALELGAELRLGQVLRVRRSDLDLAKEEVTVPGRGKKSGTTVQLIPTQLLAVHAALHGYLAALEEQFLAGVIADYPLFPAGQLTGGRKDLATARVRLSQADADPIHRRAVLAWFHEAEVLAKIPVVPGRGWYGLRRANVDGAQAEDISRAGLKQYGGWSSSQVPDEVYAKRQAKAHVLEAAQVRAKIRGVAGVDASRTTDSESALGTVAPYPAENTELASQDNRPEGQS